VFEIYQAGKKLAAEKSMTDCLRESVDYQENQKGQILVMGKLIE
jgi:hypothetical protein